MENIKITTRRLKQKTLERFAEKKQQKRFKKKQQQKQNKQATNNLNAEQSKLFAKGDKWEELE